MKHLTFQANDGGRAAAGFKGKAAGDCVCRAISIATGKPYQEIYDTLNELAKSERHRDERTRRSSARTGVHKVTYKKYLASLGWTWVPTMSIGSGCTVHLRAGEIPMDRTLIVSCSKHLVVVIDGVMHDLYDPSRGGTRCVYGYWFKPEPPGTLP